MWSEAVHGCAGSGDSGRCRPRSAATCVLPGATHHELQSNLQMAATFTGLGDVLEGPSCKLSPAATSAVSGVT